MLVGLSREAAARKWLLLRSISSMVIVQGRHAQFDQVSNVMSWVQVHVPQL